jgi:hypothetical protein
MPAECRVLRRVYGASRRWKRSMSSPMTKNAKGAGNPDAGRTPVEPLAAARPISPRIACCCGCRSKSRTFATARKTLLAAILSANRSATIRPTASHESEHAAGRR